MQTSIFPLALLGVFSPAVGRAAVIEFAPPRECVGDADVLTAGLPLYAYTWNGTPREVGGTVFSVAGTSPATAAGGNLTFSGFAMVYPTPFFSTAAPFSDLSGEYRGLLTGAITNLGDPATVTLRNLRVGVEYRLQLWIGDPRAGVTTTRTTTLSGGGSPVTVDYNTSNAAGGTGQHVTGGFVADATTQSFTLSGGAAQQINALQLRVLAGRWSGAVSGAWDEATLNFSGKTFPEIQSAGVVDFSDLDAAGNPVARSAVTIQAGGINGASAYFRNETTAYRLESADSTGLSGPFGLFKSGAGALTLAGPNTFTDATVLMAGDLTVAHPAAVAGSTVNFLSGNLHFDAVTAAAFGGLAGSQPLPLESTDEAPVALSVGQNGADTTFTGQLTGTGSLEKTGAGSLALTGIHDHAGGTFLRSGTLILSPSGHDFSPLTVTGGLLSYQDFKAFTATFPEYRQTGGVLALDIGSGGGDEVHARGDLDLTGAVVRLNPLSAPASPDTPFTLFKYGGALTGTPVIELGCRGSFTLNRGAGAASSVTLTLAAAPADLVWRGAADDQWVADPRLNWRNAETEDRFQPLDNARFDDTAARFDVVIPAGTDLAPGAVVFHHNTQNYTLSGGRIAGEGALTKEGAGTLTLASANTHTGGTVIAAGTVNAAAAGSLGTGPVTVDGVLNLVTPSVTYTGLNTRFSGGGVINVTLGVGPVITPLNGDGGGFTGTLNVGLPVGTGGRVQVNKTLGAAAVVNILPNAILLCSGGYQNASVFLHGGNTGESVGQLRLEAGATWAGPVVLAEELTSAADFTVGSGTTIASTGAISGVISETGGPRSLSKGGVGTITLSGANTFTGPVTVGVGRLHAGAGQALGAGDGTVTVKTGAALQINGGVTVSGKTLRLSGAGNGTAGTFGALQAGPGATPGVWDGPVILDGTPAAPAVIGTNGTEALPATLVLSGPVRDGSGNSVLFSPAALGKIRLSASAGQNTWTGATGLVQSTLALGADNTLPAATVLDVDSADGTAEPARFDLGGFHQEIGGLRDSATTALHSVVHNSAAAHSILTISAASTADHTFDGEVSGTLSLVKKGTGTQTFTGALTHTGFTAAEAGVLRLTSPGLPDAGDIALFSTGTLALDHTGTDTVGRLKIDGIVQPAGEWGAEGSGAPHTSPRLTGTGRLLVVGAAPDAFTAWIDSQSALTDPADKTRDADPDQDGQSNLAEFAFSGDPASAAESLLYFPAVEDTNDDDVPEAILVIALREGAVFSAAAEPSAILDGIRYTIQGASDPAAFGQPGAPAVIALGPWIPGEGGPSTPAGYAWQRFRLTDSPAPLARGFLRARVASVP